MAKTRKTEDHESALDALEAPFEPAAGPIVEETGYMPEHDGLSPAPEMLTGERFARRIKNKELRAAWLHCLNLEPKIRTQVAEAWQSEYDAWLSQPRG